MECPRCSLINPPDSVKCDCGYNFRTGQAEAIMLAARRSQCGRLDGNLRERLQKAYWPDIYDESSAKKARQQGLWAAAFCSAVTALIATAGGLSGKSYLGIDSGAFVDAGLFAVIALGIYLCWRSAAIAGLTLYIIERIVMWSEHGPKNPVIAVIIILAFINSVRATFWIAAHGQGEDVIEDGSTGYHSTSK